MDVYNGDIVSLVSSQTFEPNEFVHGLDKDYWNSLIKDEKPLANNIIGIISPSHDQDFSGLKRFK